MAKYQSIHIPSSHGQPILLQLEKPKPMTLTMYATDILDKFAQQEDMIALPVVDNKNKAVGIITRRKVLTEFSHKFSRDLNRKKRADIIMEKRALIFDCQTNLESVSQAVTERKASHAFDPVIFTDNGKYIGMLSIITLLKILTEINIKSALDCNPLSKLPGNNCINNEIDQRLH